MHPNKKNSNFCVSHCLSYLVHIWDIGVDTNDRLQSFDESLTPTGLAGLINIAYLSQPVEGLVPQHRDFVLG